MKKTFLFIAFMSALSTLQAQDYMISFEATGASTALTSITVENCTKGISVSLNGNDILHLSGITGINTFKGTEPFLIKISPNPMPGMCKVDFQTQVPGPANIELYNVSGKLVLQKAEQLIPGNHTFSLSGIKSGMYLLKITSDTKTSTSKIVSVSNAIGTAEIKRISSSSDAGNITQKPGAGMKKSAGNQKSEVAMAYSAGDHLLVKAYDGIYSSYSVLDPTLSSSFIIEFFPCIDQEKQSYPVTKIGAKWWMAKNLKSTILNDGTHLSDSLWAITDSAAYCTYLNTKNTDTINTYGRLYNWFAVNTGKLCPIGWHVPKQDEWVALTDYIGGNEVGGKLKETGTLHWLSPNPGATDLYGFSAVPGGWRSYESLFSYMGKYGLYWTSTERGTTSANVWMFEYNNDNFMSDPSQKSNGFSVRCISDL